ncbi:MAG: hypothetical protein JW881_22080 [Spirochaetales bacterium]|nr:hypothetical protein [Spirochaetales bacterium]
MVLKLSQPFPSRYGLPVVINVDTDIFTTPYPSAGCIGTDCRDRCCSGGAIMDIVAFEKLKNFRESERFKDIKWDDFAFEKDPCYPGGIGCYTPIMNGMCVFKNRETRGCGIHSFCLERGIDYRELKFFACCIFPVEVNRIGEKTNVLTAGYELRNEGFDIACKTEGGSTVYESARDDIRYYFGDVLIDILDDMKNRRIAYTFGRKYNGGSRAYL